MADPAVLFGGILVFGLLAQGGFYPAQCVALAVGLGWLALSVRENEDTQSAPGLRALAWLAGGLVVSTAANGLPTAALRSFATLAIAAGSLVAVHGIVGRKGSRAVTEPLALVGALAAVLGLVGVVFHRFPLAAHEGDVWRAASTLTYTNAAAALLCLTLPAAALRGRDRPGAASRLLAFAIITGLVSTLSRGGAVATVVMLTVCLAAGGRSLLRPLLRPAAGSAIAFAGLIPSIVNDGARPLIGIAGLVAGALVASIALGSRNESRFTRLVAASLAACLLIAPAALLWTDAGRIVTSRIGPGSGVRMLYWKTTVHAIERPLVGTGPGTFVATDVVDGEQVRLSFAHNEFLQALLETGALGLATIAVAIALLASWAWRRRPTGDRALWALAVAACSGFLAQSFLDFVWHIPLLVAVVFAWLAIATAPVTETERGSK